MNNYYARTISLEAKKNINQHRGNDNTYQIKIFH